MPIDLKCQNITRFSKEEGAYVYCNKVFVVEDDQIGLTVRCPECGGSVEAIRPESQDLAVAPHEESDEIEIETRQTNWSIEPPPEPKRQPLKKTQIPCINCHTPIARNDQVCPSCGYKQPVDDSPPEATGFQLWFKEQLTEGTSILGVTVLAIALCGILSVLCLTYSIVIYGRWAAVLGSPILLIVILLAVLVLAGRRPNESWWQATRRIVNPWTGLLILLRAWGWRETTWPFRPRTILFQRDMDFTDEQLAQLDNLDQLQVMDLEGTQLSDEGLEYLHELSRLRFLVVRRTRVTPEGVQTLQNSCPSLWIWR